MADRVRTTIFFKQGSYGWTETYFLPTTTLTNALLKAELLVSLRRALLGDVSRITYVRVSDDEKFRDSLVRVQPPDLQTGPAGNGNPDPAYTSLLLRLEGGEEHRRQLYLRGIPDSVIVEPDPPIFEAGYTKFFKNFRTELISQGWAFKVIKKPPAVPAVLITGFITATPPVVTTGAAHNLTTGDNVLIRGVKGFEANNGRGANGRWYVNVLTANSFEITGRLTPFGAYLGGGEIIKRVYGLIDVTAVELVRVTKRSTGRPFDSPRGRRRRPLQKSL